MYMYLFVFFQEYLGPLIKAIKDQDELAATEWSRSEHWATIMQLIDASNGTNQDVTAQEWTCPHCTFLNLPHLSACDMCSLPR